MKRFALFLVLALASLLSGCSRDEDVNKFIGKLDNVASEIVARVDSAKDKRAGVDAAQAYLDQSKPELSASYDDIKNIRGFQVKDETMKKLADSVLASGTKVAGLKLKYMSETMADKELDKKLDKLEKDFEAMFGG